MKLQASAAKGPQSPEAEGIRAQRGDMVQSLTRALGLLNMLAQHDQGIGLSELAKEAGLAVSTAHRLLSTLQSEKFVRFDDENGVWMIGVQAFLVGSAFLRSRELIAIARPVMRQLMERSGETVNLAVEGEGEAIYVAQIECRKTMRAIARPGGRAPLHSSGVGKALLGALSDEEVERIVARRGLPAATGKTISTEAHLWAELKAIRARGFAVDDEENAIGLRCVAAPVFDEYAKPVAAISLSGPTARIGDDVVAIFGEAVCEAAARITAGMGGNSPAET
jgi:IclR family transcriptional regulator, acetate operon repressor